MTVKTLAEKLREMRTADDMDAMTRLFGVIFCEEIGTRSGDVATEYMNRKASAPDDWPGSVDAAPIRDGRKLAKFVEPHYADVRKWRG